MFSQSINVLLQNWFDNYPNTVSIIDNDKSFTYAQIDFFSAKIAAFLETMNHGLVVIYGSNSYQYIVTLIACIKAGKTAVPIDEKLDAQRCEQIINTLENSFLVVNCNDAKNKYLSKHENYFNYDEIINRNSPRKVSLVNNSVVCLLFTSGTTNIPKGVRVTQRGILRTTYKTNYIKIIPEDIIAHHTNISFDAALFEIFIGLLNGIKIICINRAVQLDSFHYEKAIMDNKISIIFQTTSIFHKNLIHNKTSLYRDLRYLVIGGEPMKFSLVKDFLSSEHKPQTLINGYGPTEATVFSTYYEMTEVSDLPKNYDQIPIGTPIDQTIIKLINNNLQEITVSDEAGEIVIGGPGVSLGYMEEPLALQNPFVFMSFRDCGYSQFYRTGDVGFWGQDNQLYCIGRLDREVKFSGHRFNLNQVEHAVDQLTGVKQSYVIMNDEDLPFLQVFVQIDKKENIDEIILREELKTKLPNYMIPKKWIFLQEFPLNPNGKIDITELLSTNIENNQEFSISNSQMSPGTLNIEDYLCSVLQKITQSNHVDTNINFFDLGINSIEFIDIGEQLSEYFGVAISPLELYQYSTVKKLLSYIEESLASNQVQ